MKKISVIIFCRNVGTYIDRCMASIAAQTIGMDEMEIICVDAGSFDDTWERLQRWEQLFPEHVLLIPLREECGLETARGIALQYASAEWIAFADAGDRIEPDHLVRLYEDVVNHRDGVVQEQLFRRAWLMEHLLFLPEDRGTEAIAGRKLRIIQFYSGTESFNFFTDRLTEELQKRGHEIFVCDLDDISSQTEHSYDHLNRFLSQKVDVVICFDGIGTREEQFIRQWDSHQAVVLDILMDPPFRFHPTLEKHPKEYMLFCCDQEHVAYVKKYFPKEVPDRKSVV